MPSHLHVPGWGGPLSSLMKILFVRPSLSVLLVAQPPWRRLKFADVLSRERGNEVAVHGTRLGACIRAFSAVIAHSGASADAAP